MYVHAHVKNRHSNSIELFCNLFKVTNKQSWAKLLRSLTVNSLSYFVKIKILMVISFKLQRPKNFFTVTSLTPNAVKKKVTVTSLPLIAV